MRGRKKLPESEKKIPFRIYIPSKIIDKHGGEDMLKEKMLSFMYGDEDICDNPKWLNDALKNDGETHCPECGKKL
jgi:hypothetical protein